MSLDVFIIFESMITYWQTRVTAATVSRMSNGDLEVKTLFLFLTWSSFWHPQLSCSISPRPMWKRNMYHHILNHHMRTKVQYRWNSITHIQQRIGDIFYYKLLLQLRHSKHILKGSQIPRCNFLHTKASHGNLTRALPLVSWCTKPRAGELSSSFKTCVPSDFST